MRNLETERLPLETQMSLGLNDHLAAVAVGREPSNPYRVSGEEAKKSGEIRQLTSDLGQLCEECLLERWSGKREELTDRGFYRATVEVLSRLEFLGEKTCSVGEIIGAYQELGESIIPFSRGEIVASQSEALNLLIQHVDDFYGVHLGEIYEDLASVSEGGAITSKIRYFIDTVLILAKEICLPTFPTFPRRGDFILEPDMNYRWRNHHISQFDAILIDEWASRLCFYGRSRDLNNVLSGGWHYSIVEIKTPFRTAETTGQNKLKRPRRRHLRRISSQIGKVALNWEGRGKGEFLFPEFLEFIYLRGPLPHVICRVDLDLAFFKEWRETLEANMNGLGHNPRKAFEMEKLTSIVVREAEKAERN